MAQYWALMWDIKPGSQDAVRQAFKEYGRPDHTIRDDDGNPVGTLISTQVFMKNDTVIRVVETTDDVPLPVLGQHMGRQPAIRELEDKLDEYVAEPRDMSTSEGSREFFMKSTMELLVTRRHDE
ncbi:MAG: SchA/CurD-like domain-containing protein [Solirubrobacteraceae bacterium]